MTTQYSEPHANNVLFREYEAKAKHRKPNFQQNMQSLVRNLLRNESTILLFVYKDLKPFIDNVEELQSGSEIHKIKKSGLIKSVTQSMRRRLFSANLEYRVPGPLALVPCS